MLINVLVSLSNFVSANWSSVDVSKRYDADESSGYCTSIRRPHFFSKNYHRKPAYDSKCQTEVSFTSNYVNRLTKQTDFYFSQIRQDREKSKARRITENRQQKCEQKGTVDDIFEQIRNLQLDMFVFEGKRNRMYKSKFQNASRYKTTTVRFIQIRGNQYHFMYRHRIKRT